MKSRFQNLITVSLTACVFGCANLPSPNDEQHAKDVTAEGSEVNVDNFDDMLEHNNGLQNLETTTDTIPIQDLLLFSEIFDEVHRNYVDEVSDEQLLQDAIRGMLGGLDPHSKFYSADEFSEFNDDAQGKFTGIGVEIGTESGEIVIISPIENSPAYEAGIKAGDIVRAIDENVVEDFNIEDAVNLMRGEPGSTVSITVERPSTKEVLTLEIERKTIRSSSVSSELLQDEYVFIRITQFQHDTKDKLVEQFQEKSNGRNIKGIILDLRNNPGGLLQSAVEVSDAFLSSGSIVFTRGRGSHQQTGFTSTASDISDGLPIIVLINSGSASAAEIVAGALQDNDRAIILGTRSFGKGSVQSIRQLSDGKAIKLTTARYYTPNEHSIQALGIEPDIEVPQIDIGTDISAHITYREENLQGHLANEANDISESEQLSGNEESKSSRRLQNDFQLSQAIIVLKTLELKN